jgi:hypothetical protein
VAVSSASSKSSLSVKEHDKTHAVEASSINTSQSSEVDNNQANNNDLSSSSLNSDVEIAPAKSKAKAN